MAKSVLNIEGMSCGHCVESITEVLHGLTGVQEASVVLEENAASISYDEAKITVSEIKKAVEDAGYSVTETT